LITGILKGLRPLSGVWGKAPDIEKEEKTMKEREMDIRELMCAPEATDDLEDIEFDDDDVGAEEEFIRGWLREEREYMERNQMEGQG
jgi:hypothetical protein